MNITKPNSTFLASIPIFMAGLLLLLNVAEANASFFSGAGAARTTAIVSTPATASFFSTIGGVWHEAALPVATQNGSFFGAFPLYIASPVVTYPSAGFFGRPIFTAPTPAVQPIEPSPTIGNGGTVTSPATGEFTYIGATKRIAWSGFEEPVDIYAQNLLPCNATGPCIAASLPFLIASNVSGGSYDWHVGAPNIAGKTGYFNQPTSSGMFWIIVQDRNGSAKSGAFTITSDDGGCNLVYCL